MVTNGLPERRLLLFYCFLTCIYLPGVIIVLKLSNNLYNIGTYKFLPILTLLIIAELIKLLFSLLQVDLPLLGKTVPKPRSRNDKSWTRTAKNASKFIFATLVVTAIYCFIVVIFGAPLLTHHEETLMLAVTLTTLTWIPAGLHLGVDTALVLFIGDLPRNGSLLVEAITNNVKFALLGTWIGATVIPLDWDRPWQAWPIPCMIGALVGYTVAHFVTPIRMVLDWKWKEKLHQ